MSDEDRRRWDDRYARIGPAPPDEPGAPAQFAPYEDVFPTTGRALELACGRGRGAVWLARRGLDMWAVDVSPVAIEMARHLAARCGVVDRCRFDVVDLDGGLPPGPPVDVILCRYFRDARLDDAIVNRLSPGGILAITVLSTVGAGEGSFRAPPGELRRAFGSLDVVADGEGGGEAWLLARRPSEQEG